MEIRVWSDFVCPFCLIAEKPLREAIAESGIGAHIEWMPFELRPEPAPTLRPEDPYLQAVWPRSVYPLARAFGVELRLPGISPQPHTALAWEGFQFAREHGHGDAYNSRVLRAFFQEDRNIGEAAALVSLAAEVGLDADAFGQALADRRYREAHRRALGAARTAGVSAVPTILIGDRRFTGAQERRVLVEALQRAGAMSA